MKVEYAAAAQAELFETIEYYEEQRVGLGERFFDHVEAALARTVESPLSGATLGVAAEGPIRMIRLAAFPYKMPYVLRAEVLLILAVAHQRRRPLYWLERLER